MKRVGVREFRDRATYYLAGNEALAIERHGQTIGFYIPASANRREQLNQAIDRLEQTIERVMSETGLSEDEIVALFDPNTPLPEPRVGELQPMSMKAALTKQNGG